MYQPYPSGGKEPVPDRPEPPQSVITATRIMYVGAVLSLIELIASLVTISSLRTTIRQQFPHYTPTQVHNVLVGITTVAVVEGLLAVGLWILMARASRAGKNWARITSSVLFGISTLSFFFSLSRSHTGLGLVAAAIVWVVGLGAIYFLWQRDSTAYFQSS